MPPPIIRGRRLRYDRDKKRQDLQRLEQMNTALGDSKKGCAVQPQAALQGSPGKHRLMMLIFAGPCSADYARLVCTVETHHCSRVTSLSEHPVRQPLLARTELGATRDSDSRHIHGLHSQQHGRSSAEHERQETVVSG